jgi:hypothetical protein
MIKEAYIAGEQAAFEKVGFLGKVRKGITALFGKGGRATRPMQGPSRPPMQGPSRPQGGTDQFFKNVRNAPPLSAQQRSSAINSMKSYRSPNARVNNPRKSTYTPKAAPVNSKWSTGTKVGAGLLGLGTVGAAAHTMTIGAPPRNQQRRPQQNNPYRRY